MGSLLRKGENNMFATCDTSLRHTAIQAALLTWTVPIFDTEQYEQRLLIERKTRYLANTVCDTH
jgi:hypothetical protein